MDRRLATYSKLINADFSFDCTLSLCRMNLTLGSLPHICPQVDVWSPYLCLQLLGSDASHWGCCHIWDLLLRSHIFFLHLGEFRSCYICQLIINKKKYINNSPLWGNFFRAVLLVAACSLNLVTSCLLFDFIIVNYLRTIRVDYMVFTTDLLLETFLPWTTHGWETYGCSPFAAYDMRVGEWKLNWKRRMH